MVVDIVFISYNRSSEVQTNLDKMSSYPLLNKIIWVDNASTDNVGAITFDSSKVTLIKLEKNIGISAYNVGAAASSADIIIVLDDDSHVDESAVLATIQTFENDKDLGALAYKIILPATNEVVTRDWKEGPATHFWGCGAAIRKSVWDKLGGYREELFLYANEYDLCIRIWNLGYKVLYTSDIAAYHRVSSMNRTSGRLVSYSIRNNAAFVKTYFDDKYQFKLFFYDRMTWFIRAVLSGATSSIFEGLKMAKEMAPHITKYKISDDVQQFYINNLRLFEPPLRKILRKNKHGLLFKVSKNV